MTNIPTKTADSAQAVVPFPHTDEERARRLRLDVEGLAQKPTVEWKFYIETTDVAAKHGIDKATLTAMVETVIAENEKKQREARGELRRAEKKRDMTERESERKTERRQREKRKEAERREREERKVTERKEKEKQKAFASIVKLPTSEHEAKLKTLARQLDEDVEVLREEFAELRTEEEERIKRGEVDPWEAPVNTHEILNAVAAKFGEYVIIHDQVIAPIIPLWIAFAWVHDIAAFSPILVFESADTGEAKSAASKMVALQTPRACILVEPTGPAFYHLIDRTHPTLVIDDADKLLPRRPDLAHIVNAGWMRGNSIPRVDVKTNEVHRFDTFCPKVINGINLLAHLAPATRTRCITIKMLPKLESEKVANHRHADRDESFVILRRKLLRWATDNMSKLDNAEPKMPEGIFSRLEENYHLMFAIADLAGGGWPKKARAAAIRLTAEHNSPSAGKNLLSIMFDLTVKRRTTLFTSEQLPQLVADESDEFANYKHGRMINKYEIAILLRPYCGIHPDLIHPRGGKTADRGYDTTWPEFTRAFKHYLGKALPGGRSVVRKARKK
jgi:Protein of unknown function (DUF3631)